MQYCTISLAQSRSMQDLCNNAQFLSPSQSPCRICAIVHNFPLLTSTLGLSEAKFAHNCTNTPTRPLTTPLFVHIRTIPLYMRRKEGRRQLTSYSNCIYVCGRPTFEARTPLTLLTRYSAISPYLYSNPHHPTHQIFFPPLPTYPNDQ